MGCSFHQTELSRAFIPLVVAYGQGIDINPLNIYVGENDGTDGGLDTRYYNGTDADLLIGGAKNDLIFGESGR